MEVMCHLIVNRLYFILTKYLLTYNTWSICFIFVSIFFTFPYYSVEHSQVEERHDSEHSHCKNLQRKTKKATVWKWRAELTCRMTLAVTNQHFTRLKQYTQKDILYFIDMCSSRMSQKSVATCYWLQIVFILQTICQ